MPSVPIQKDDFAQSRQFLVTVLLPGSAEIPPELLTSEVNGKIVLSCGDTGHVTSQVNIQNITITQNR